MARALAKSEDLSNSKLEDDIKDTSWTTRRNGYEKLATIFKNLEPRSPHWERLTFFIKALSQEKNVPTLEKGLEATLTFVQICGNMTDETVVSLLNGVVMKWLGDQKVRISELAHQICLVLFEKRKHELVIEMLLEGMEGPNVKKTSACLRTLSRALMVFGAKMVDVSLITPRVARLCLHKPLIQQEVKDLLKEIYALIGTEIRPYLVALDASQTKTINAEFEIVDRAKAQKTTSGVAAMKSDQQAKAPKTPSSARPKSSRVSKISPDSAGLGRPLSTASRTIKNVAERIKSPIRPSSGTSPGSAGTKKQDGACGDRFGSARTQNYRPNNQIAGLDDVFLMVESKQWGDRKVALEALLNIINSDGTISHPTFYKIIKCLRILILNDTNVLLVSKAVQCVTALAKKDDHEDEFRPHAALMMTLLLEKFKEKKSVLVEAIREAIDTIYSNCSFATIVRYVSLSLEHQNPAVKSETQLFLWRCFTNPNSEILKPSYWHQLVGNLVKNLSYQDQNVRQNAAKALGAMMKAVREHNLSPLLRNVQKHHMDMIYKFSNEAIIEYKRPLSSILNENSDQSFLGSDEVDKDVMIRPANNIIKVPAKMLRTVYMMAEDGARSYSSDENQISKCTDERFFDAEERCEDSKGRSVTSQRSRKPRAKLSKTKAEEGKRPKSSLEPEAYKDGSAKNSKIKSRSPKRQQHLDTLQLRLDELKSGRNPRSPLNSAKQEIAKKLENLESSVDVCFEEVRQLSPFLYDEMAEPGTQINGSPTVLREFNQKLSRMEGLLKSMAFKEGVSGTRGNVQVGPAVIRQGNGNWFIEGGY